MKEKRNYEQPSMKVLELKHQSHILAGSGESRSSAGVSDYTWQDVTEE